MRQMIIVAVVLLSVLSNAGAQTDVATEIAKSLEKIEKLADQAKWKKVQTSLSKLLEAHEDGSHFFIHKRKIIELLKDAAFHTEYPDVKPKDVVHGELKSYNAKTGKIHIIWNGNWRDFERGEAMRIHEAKLAGPSTIEISGVNHPNGKSLSAIIDSSRDSAYVVVFGCEQHGDSWYPGRIRYSGKDDDEWKDLDYKEMSPVQGGKKFKFKVKVTARGINAYYNGRSFLSAKKKKKSSFGYWGFDRNAGIETVTLKGTVEPSWIKSKIDAKRQENRERFELTYKPSQVAPAWLLSLTAGKLRSVKTETRDQPGKIEKKHRREIAQIELLLESNAYASALKLTRQSPILPQVTKDWFICSAYIGLKNWKLALSYADKVVEADTSFYGGHASRAACLEKLLREKEAIAEWEIVSNTYPGETEPYSELALLYLQANRIEDAKKLLDKAKTLGIEDRDIRALDLLIFRAGNGPKWEKTYTWKSRHYEVHTDIDKETARAASDVLEKAHSAYAAYMGRKTEKDGRLFKVYIFAGEAGYQSYVSSLFGAPATHTAGLYYPLLKQLLIWNLADRKSMFKTVQHEGFHQYVDSITKEMPYWLDEGTAEYYETATSGKWTKTPVRHDHLEELGSGVGDLSKFVHISYRDFYANAGYNYARGWALVYFLRHSTPANKKVLDTLHEKLRSGLSRRQAITEVFGKLDMKQMKTDLEAFLTELQNK